MQSLLASLIGASNFFELAVAVAIPFWLSSGAALATVVGVLEEVPIMLNLVFIANRTQHWFQKLQKCELIEFFIICPISLLFLITRVIP